MTSTASTPAHDLDILRQQARTAHLMVRLSVAGVTHEESLIQPQPGGNCLNWVVGHLLWAEHRVLSVLQQSPAMDETRLKRYARRGPPLQDPAEAVGLGDLMAAWDACDGRMDAGLAGLTPEALDQPVANSPTNNPNETVRSLLGTFMFHQAYHAGQTGLLRRLVGKEGAVR
jgi:uncharacterized damage-inducible protein DinB